MEGELPTSGREFQLLSFTETFSPITLGAKLPLFFSFPRLDSYFGIVSSAHEAHALIDAAKLGVRRRFVLKFRSS